MRLTYKSLELDGSWSSCSSDDMAIVVSRPCCWAAVITWNHIPRNVLMPCRHTCSYNFETHCCFVYFKYYELLIYIALLEVYYSAHSCITTVLLIHSVSVNFIHILKRGSLKLPPHTLSFPLPYTSIINNT